MAIYETVFILRQDLTTQQVEELTKGFKEIITSNKGKILKEENWGLRNLAYKIKKNKKGHYVLLESESPAEAISEFERKMGINENVLRFMTIKLAKASEGPSAILSQKDMKEERK